MFFFLLYAAKSESDKLILFNKNRLIKELKNNKKISEIVDIEFYKKEYPQASKFFDVIESFTFPQNECMGEVIRSISYNCDELDEEQQKTLALRFTQCYFNLTNRRNEFPYDIPEERQITEMKKSTYNIFKILKMHVTNLCYFAKVSAFNSFNAESIINLFDAVIKSTEAMKQTDKEINVQRDVLVKYITEIKEKLSKGNTSLVLLNSSLSTFHQRIGPMIKEGKKVVQNFKKFQFYIIILLSTCVVIHYLPEVLIIILPLTALIFIIDRKLTKNYGDEWENSLWKKIGKTLYLTLCMSYPCYIFVINVMTTITSIYRQITGRKKTVRIGKIM